MLKRTNALFQRIGLPFRIISTQSGDGLTIDEYAQMVDKQTRSRGGLWSTPGILLKMLEEFGEIIETLKIDRERGINNDPKIQLLRIVTLYGKMARDLNIECPQKKEGKEAPTDVGKEIHDLLYAIFCLAQKHGIDVPNTMRQKFQEFEQRDKKRFG